MRVALSLATLLVTVGCASRAPAQGTTLTNSQSQLEARVKMLEDKLVQYGEALEFLNKVYAQQKAQAEAGSDEPDPKARFAVDIARDVAAGKIDGPAKAPVTIVKVFDFACPYCHRMAETLDEVVKAYKGKVRVVYVDLVVHPDTASKAHYAACAAAKQGKYVAFKNAVWEKGFVPYANTRDATKLDETNLLAIGKGVGLDTKKLAADMNSESCKQLVRDDMAEMDKFKVNATPTLFVNGKIIAGAMPLDELKQMVDEELKVVDASGAGADYYDKVVLATGEKKFKAAR